MKHKRLNLNLRRETVRVLTSRDLAAAGGEQAITRGDTDCPTSEAGSCNYCSRFWSCDRAVC